MQAFLDNLHPLGQCAALVAATRTGVARARARRPDSHAFGTVRGVGCRCAHRRRARTDGWEGRTHVHPCCARRFASGRACRRPPPRAPGASSLARVLIHKLARRCDSKCQVR
eukprot:6208738-Pleurochrysis_carterae.AAC.2